MGAIIESLKQLGQIFQWWIVIAPWEEGLRVRLGRRITILHAGPHLRVPFIDAVYVQSTRRRIVNLPIQTVTTRDGKTLTFSGTLGYSIADVLKLYSTLHHAHDTIQNFALQALAERVSVEDAERLSAGALGSLTLDLAPYGISETKISVTDFAFVRTYRLISDQKWGGYGDTLSTQVAP